MPCKQLKHNHGHGNRRLGTAIQFPDNGIFNLYFIANFKRSYYDQAISAGGDSQKIQQFVPKDMRRASKQNDAHTFYLDLCHFKMNFAGL